MYKGEIYIGEYTWEKNTRQRCTRPEDWRPRKMFSVYYIRSIGNKAINIQNKRERNKTAKGDFFSQITLYLKP